MPQNKPKNQQNIEFIEIPTNFDTRDLMEQLKKANEDQTKPDIWKILEERKRRGHWNGEIQVLPIKTFSLIKGKHYYVVENNRKRSIKCIACPVVHGTFLESHMLTRYKLEDGVLSVDGKPLNDRAEHAIDNR